MESESTQWTRAERVHKTVRQRLQCAALHKWEPMGGRQPASDRAEKEPVVRMHGITAACPEKTIIGDPEGKLSLRRMQVRPAGKGHRHVDVMDHGLIWPKGLVWNTFFHIPWEYVSWHI